MSTLTEARPEVAAEADAATEMTYRDAVNAALDDAMARTPRSSSWARTSRARAASSRRTPGCPEKYGERVLQHADLRERLHGRGPGDVGRGHAPDRRVHVRRLHADGRRRDRQPAAQVPLHGGRPVQRPGHDPRRVRRGRPLRHAAQRHRRELVHGAAGHARRRGRHARGRVRDPARGDPQRTTRSSSTSTRCSTAARARSAAARSPRSARPRSSVPATDVTIVASLADGRVARSRRRRSSPRRASRRRSSTCAGCGPSTWRRSGRRSRKTGRLVIAEEQWHEAGWGATIISRLAQRGHGLQGAAGRGEPAPRPAHPLQPAPGGRVPAVRRSHRRGRAGPASGR